jgi:mono/diheme cytochrome c family protein
MNRTFQRLARWGAEALAALAVALPAAAWAAHPVPITLKDASGTAIAAGSTAPISTERTCGGCHGAEWATVTQGYHFQQGRTNGAGRLNVSDSFVGALIGAYADVAGDADVEPTKGTGAWWKLSDGMYGKW